MILHNTMLSSHGHEVSSSGGQIAMESPDEHAVASPTPKGTWEEFNKSLIDAHVMLKCLENSQEPFAPVQEAIYDVFTKFKRYKEQDIGHVKVPLLKWKLMKNIESLKGGLTEFQQKVGAPGTGRYEEVSRNIELFLHELDTKVKDLVEHGTQFVPLTVPKFVVGQDHHVRRLKEMLLGDPKDLGKHNGVVGIRGMGGAGKTVLARTLYNDEGIADSFCAMCFISMSKDLVISKYQEQICRDFLGDLDLVQLQNEDSKERRAQWLRMKLRGRKVLLVLDDVRAHQLSDTEDLMVHDSTSGSRVLFTTRMGYLFRGDNNAYQYDLGELDTEDSLALFCFHCFGQPTALNNFSLVSEVVGKCGGLPLCLEVMGSTVAYNASSMDEDILEASLCVALENLTKPVPSHSKEGMELIHRLKWSYDVLDATEQRCFLHFASVPKGYRLLVADVIYVWSATESISDSRAKVIWGQLMSVGLVKADPQGAVGHELSDAELALGSTGFQDIWSTPCFAHDIIHDMAQYIIQQEVPREKWYSTGPAPALSEVFQDWPHIIPGKELALTSKKIEKFYEHIKLTNVQVLLLRDTSLGVVPPGVFSAANLCVLDLSFCGITALPEDIAALKHLKLLNLDACDQLETLSEHIGAVDRLTVLSLRHCSHLGSLPESIGSLGQLTALNAPGCGFFQLPNSLGNLSKLQQLDLGSCSKLMQLPLSISALTALEHLNLSWLDGIAHLPDGFGAMTNLRKLFIGGCLRLSQLPDSITKLNRLVVLDMQYCMSIKSLPVTVGALSRLRKLHLEYCLELKSFPESMNHMSSLQILGLGADGSQALRLKSTLPYGVQQKSLPGGSLKIVNSFHENHMISISMVRRN